MRDPGKSKFELIIEKATELGADEIIPLKTKRAEMELKGGSFATNDCPLPGRRGQSAKRFQRSRVPVIQPIADFASTLKSFTKETAVFIPSLPEGGGEGGERRNIFEAFKAVPSPSRVAFLIGPEGDFTPQEYDLARAHGCISVSLGKTVLKVETAALVAVACAQLWFRR